MFLQAGAHRPASRDLVEARLARQRSALEASCLKLSSLGEGDVRRGDVLCVGCKLFKMSTIWFATSVRPTSCKLAAAGQTLPWLRVPACVQVSCSSSVTVPLMTHRGRFSLISSTSHW